MKSLLRIIGLILLVFSIHSCEDKPTPPQVTTTAVSEISTTAARSGGTITAEGGSAIISCGVCWSTGIEPTITEPKTSDAATADSFTSNMTDLKSATLYYVRAYATNSVGTGYGKAISFTTLGQVPSASNSEVTNVTITSATLNGSVNANYLSTVVSFEYGTTASYGQSATAVQSPVTGNTVTTISTDIAGLTPGTSYHYRIKAVNSLGTSYSSDNTFVTLGRVPAASTIAATKITSEAAQLNGSVNANYLSAVVTFEYGTSTSYGQSVNVTASPVTGNTISNVSENITDLTAGTTYHYRIKAVNSLGTTYGNDMTFRTTFDGVTGTVSDNEGNTYTTIGIGYQIWMRENLKVTKYSNGDLIGTTSPATLDISGEPSPKYQWAYEGNERNVALTGRLYTWYAVKDGRNVCPDSWHIPSHSEWTALAEYLGGTSEAGGKMKETGTIHWNSPNTGATNESGFTALPSGMRGVALHDYYFCCKTTQTFWWSSDEYSAFEGVFWGVNDSNKDLFKYQEEKGSGLAIRCLRD